MTLTDRRSRNGERGFTLLEVMAALVIVSLGMLAVITAVSQTASNSAYLRDKTIAHWVAMNRVTEARLQTSPPKIDKTSDEIEMGGRRWRWTMTVSATAMESMRRIDVDVRPVEADEKSSMATVTGFYGAALAPPGAAGLVSWLDSGQSTGPGSQPPGGNPGSPNGPNNPGSNPNNPGGPGDDGGGDIGGPGETEPTTDPSDPNTP